jgi:hypothetical protein
LLLIIGFTHRLTIVHGYEPSHDLRAHFLLQEGHVSVTEDSENSTPMVAEDLIVGAAVVVGPRAGTAAGTIAGAWTGKGGTWQHPPLLKVTGY